MRTKMVDGKQVPLSAEEEALRDAEEKAWAEDASKREARKKIAQLEALITERRKREAILSQSGKDWLANVEAQISIERGKF